MIDFKESVFKIINEIKTDSMLMYCFSGIFLIKTQSLLCPKIFMGCITINPTHLVIF